MEWYEAAFDRMYPIIYRRRDVEEARDVIDAFYSFLEGREPVLDLACGEGRYMEALLKKGLTVFGVDLSLYLLEANERRWGRGDSLVQADMRRLPFLDGSIGSVLSMFTSFGYFSRDTDNLFVFQEIYRVLERGGVFLFDFINAHRISPAILEDSERTEGDYRIEETRRLEERGKYLVKDIEITNLLDGERTTLMERLRLYTKEELLAALGNLGFAVIALFGDYDGSGYIASVSERLIVVASKP